MSLRIERAVYLRCGGGHRSQSCFAFAAETHLASAGGGKTADDRGIARPAPASRPGVTRCQAHTGDTVKSRIEVATDASQQPGGRDPATGVSGMDLRSAMSRLDPADRELIALRYVAGFDSKELAIALGMKPGTVRQRLRRLLDRLREDLNDV